MAKRGALRNPMDRGLVLMDKGLVAVIFRFGLGQIVGAFQESFLLF